jgi:parallel beta-helix repeat protein
MRKGSEIDALPDFSETEIDGLEYDTRIRICSIILLLALLLSVILLSIIPNVPTDPPKLPQKGLEIYAYTPHVPIRIDNDSDFSATVISNGWNGTGSSQYPYRITNLDIDTTGISYAIYIGNTTACFEVSDCYLRNYSSSAILLQNVTDGQLINNSCSGSTLGITLEYSRNCSICSNNCSGNAEGVWLHYSNNCEMLNNSCSNGGVGIALWGANNSIIRNNICSNGSSGISIFQSTNCTVNENLCSDNENGIEFYNCIKTTIVANRCHNNSWCGIDLYETSYSSVADNFCFNSTVEGIRVSTSTNDVLRNNTVFRGGIQIGGSFVDLNQWNTHDIDTSNIVNGKPLYYLRNCTGGTVPLGAGQVVLANCTDMIVRDQDLGNVSEPIAIGFCTNVTVTNNTCKNNYWCSMSLTSSVGCRIENNSFSDNVYEGMNICSTVDSVICNNTIENCRNGIVLTQYSNGNSIYNNSISNNRLIGIEIWLYSTHNLIYNNLISQNVGYGVSINSWCERNRIWNNSFVENNGAGDVYDAAHIQAYDLNGKSSGNLWNATGFGNYWSDWKTPDIAPPFGIVDDPYLIQGSGGAKDYFPLKPSDLSPPITTVSLSGTLGTNGWYTSPVTVSLHATDSDSGVNATFYRIGTSGSWLNYSSSFLISSEGNSTVQFCSRDNAGNNETVRSIVIKIDTKSPTTHATVSGSSVTLSASDNISGVNRTKYRVDSGMWLNYSGAFKVTVTGNHTIEFYSIDNAGNNESIKTTWVTNGDNGSLGSIFSQYGIAILGFIIAIIVVIAVYHALSTKGKENE